jgi:hypothetical protein
MGVVNTGLTPAGKTESALYFSESGQAFKKPDPAKPL